MYSKFQGKQSKTEESFCRGSPSWIRISQTEQVGLNQVQCLGDDESLQSHMPLQSPDPCSLGPRKGAMEMGWGGRGMGVSEGLVQK